MKLPEKSDVMSKNSPSHSSIKKGSCLLTFRGHSSPHSLLLLVALTCTLKYKRSCTVPGRHDGTLDTGCLDSDLHGATSQLQSRGSLLHKLRTLRSCLMRLLRIRGGHHLKHFQTGAQYMSAENKTKPQICPHVLAFSP